jgi:hypothetical protein
VRGVSKLDLCWIAVEVVAEDHSENCARNYEVIAIAVEVERISPFAFACIENPAERLDVLVRPIQVDPKDMHLIRG